MSKESILKVSEREQILSHRNKKQEKLYFEIFKESCSVLPLITHVEHTDNPEFLISHSAGVLGIELTQLFKVTNRPNAPQALESFRQQIVESAQKCCEKDIPPLQVKVWFSFDQKVPKNRPSEIKRLGQKLVELVKKWNYENPSSYRGVLRPSSEIPVPFSEINIIRRRSTHYWSINSAALQLNFPIEKIQSCIDEKNRRYEEYLKRCDECWLLIEVDIFKDSQSFGMHDQTGHRFESKFARVFYMDASHRKDLRELPIKRVKSYEKISS
jgi:hypothetical protein